MSKVRVYELARELGYESKKLIKVMMSINIKVLSHQSSISKEQILKIRSFINKTDTANQPKVVVRRRKKVIQEQEESSSSLNSLEINSTDTTTKPFVKIEKDLSQDTIEQSTQVEPDTPIKTKELQPSIDTPTPHVQPAKEQVDSNKTEDINKKTAVKDTSNISPISKSEQKEKTNITLSTENKAQIVRRATPEESKAISLRHERAIFDKRSQQEITRSSGSYSNTKLKRTPSNNSKFDSSAPKLPIAKGADKPELESNRRGGSFTKTKASEEAISTVAKRKTFTNKEKLSTKSLLEKTAQLETNIYRPPRKKRIVFGGGAGSRRRERKLTLNKKATILTTPRAAYRIVKISNESIIIANFAKQMSVKSSDIIKKLMDQGMSVTVNQSIDFDTASLVAAEYKYECKNVSSSLPDILGYDPDSTEETVSRPPIITVMGHVDHGKTSILDTIRQSDVVSKEAGGITQHIGAYQIHKNKKTMTFLDTPGHEAFSSMRARGAQLTDIIVLVVAADDGVMPQTIEAISHAKNANVPLIVAINKIDKKNANLDKIYSELGEHGIQSEDWGGDTQFIKVSALKKEGFDELLEAILLQSEILELTARSKGFAQGVIVESHLDKGKGAVATVIITQGNLKIGDFITVGEISGRVRRMTNDKSQKLKEAFASTPVEIIGLDSSPMSGNILYAVKDEKTAKTVCEYIVSKDTKADSESNKESFEELLDKLKSEKLPNLPLIIKADTQGSLEAISDAISKLKSEQVTVQLTHKGVGGINESDANLAITSSAVILAFNVRAPRSVVSKLEKQNTPIKYFNIIYELITAIKELMHGKLPPVSKEVVQGHAEVREVIRIPKIGAIAGSFVTDGKITRNDYLKLIRDNVVIYSGKLSSLRRFKDDVKEVSRGYECGISTEPFKEIKVGDIIECYAIEETAAQLDL
jgi:translation initiation factor IF-2